jgi:hypothetical protein
VEALQLTPPWGTNIRPTITSLSNSFQTSRGGGLLTVLGEALCEGQRSGTGVRVG